jgi:transcriptional regulator with XRE-family HTH domain
MIPDGRRLGGRPVNQRIAARVSALRARAGLSLEALAALARVGRSTLSLIERAESSATAVVLDKIAAALGVPLASLFDEEEAAAAPQPLSRRADQLVWRDPASGYLRRTVSPPDYPSPIRIVEVRFPPGGRIRYDSGPRARPYHQQIWVLRGLIDFTLGAHTHRLEAGDCLALSLDRPSGFHNPTRKPAHYVVVVATGAVTPDQGRRGEAS